MTAWMAFALCIPGFALLALAMERHAEQLYGRALARPRRLVSRVAGAALLSLSLVACVRASGTSVGLAEWLGVLTLGALLVAIVLAYVPRRLPAVGGIALAAAIALLLRF